MTKVKKADQEDRHALEHLARMCDKESPKSVAVPPLATLGDKLREAIDKRG